MSGTSLCGVCAKLNISLEKFKIQEPEVDGSSVVLCDPHQSGLGPFDLSFLDSIYSRRQHCQFCFLIYRATRSHPEAHVGHDGLDSNGDRISCKLEWHLDLRDSLGSAKTRRIVVSTSCTMIPSIYVVPLTRPDDRAIGFGTYVRKRANVQRLRQWFQACFKHHQCANSTGGESTIRPARLLNIRDQVVKLVPSSEGLEYATLSYVWGARPFSHLSKSSYKHLTIQGAPLDELPPTIRGAFFVARSLGIHFVWVDALCIVQDDIEDKQREINKMHGIFNNAIITVCAASGTVYDGITGMGDVIRPKLDNLFEVNQQRLTAIHPVSHLISTTQWESRAWTFQERLLSRRCIIFTPTEMIWQCRDATWRESVLLCLSDKSWTLDSIDSPYLAAEGNPVRRYASCVELYSGRRLTLHDDKLAAFEGISQILAAELGSESLFGLPTRYFDWAILWDSEQGGLRIPSFPSWSWCGWHHEVRWRVSMLKGIYSDFHAWLRAHTWVIWRYADCGKWRLVWDVESQSSTSTGHGRWNGYSGGSGPYGRDNHDVLRDIRRILRLGELDTAAGYLLESTLTPPSGQNQLSFTTFTGIFALSRHTLSTAMFPSDQKGLRRFGITDKSGDWCGTVMLDPSQWLCEVGGLFEFAAISTARDYSMEELDTWTYYIPQERDQVDWYCFYAIMLKPVELEFGIHERVGLAKIFRSAFSTGSYQRTGWKQIILQ